MDRPSNIPNDARKGDRNGEPCVVRNGVRKGNRNGVRNDER